MRAAVQRALRVRISRGQRLLAKVNGRISTNHEIELLGLLADSQDVLGEAIELVLRSHLEATVQAADNQAGKPPAVSTRAAGEIMQALERLALSHGRSRSLAKPASSVRRRSSKKAPRLARRT